MINLCTSASVLLLSAFAAGAVELSGTVIRTSPDSAVVVVLGDQVPNPGDAAKIYFTLPGGDDEVLVATGKVKALLGDAVNVRLDDAKANVQVNQLARFTSAEPKPAPKRLSLADVSGPPRKGKLVISDDFDSGRAPIEQQDGEDRQTSQEIDGELKVTVSIAAKSFSPWPYRHLKLQDVYLEASVRAGEMPPGSFLGLIFRQRGADDRMSYCSVNVDAGGTLLELLCGSDAQKPHSQHRRIPADLWKTNGANVLGVEAIGTTVRVFVNATLAAAFENTLVREEGWTGFYIDAGKDYEPSTAFFDQLRVYEVAPVASRDPSRP